MKKWKAGLVLSILLCLIPLCAALARTGKVTASSLNIRQSANSSSKVVGVLRQGASVNILDSSGSWYKISSGGKKGYVYKKFIQLTGSSGNPSTRSSGTSSKRSTGNSDGTCGPGDTGSAVRRVQERLKKLGYYTGGIDGDYGNGTKTAVKNFQRRNGLSVTGSVNSRTLSKLNSSSARRATSSDAVGDSSRGRGGTERLNWFNGGSNKIPKGATFKVKDIRTGKVFTAKRWSGANHLDAEPASASDTAIMKRIYGHWSWRRRAVLVKYNGHVYAASMNGMPHGTQTIKGNNFNGHFCIHFYGSKTHGSRKVDSMHQSCVAEAMKHSW